MSLKDTWVDLKDAIEGVPHSGDGASAETINKIAHAVIELEENGGGITKETDPTVPYWAKQPNKPKYTAEEIGAAHRSDLGNVKELEIGNDAVEGINLLYRDKADKSTTYTKTEVDNLINSAIGEALEGDY